MIQRISMNQLREAQRCYYEGLCISFNNELRFNERITENQVRKFVAARVKTEWINSEQYKRIKNTLNSKDYLEVLLLLNSVRSGVWNLRFALFPKPSKLNGGSMFFYYDARTLHQIVPKEETQ
jgi:hypothetical protein